MHRTERSCVTLKPKLRSLCILGKMEPRYADLKILNTHPSTLNDSKKAKVMAKSYMENACGPSQSSSCYMSSYSYAMP
jgi:hypothetical protein